MDTMPCLILVTSLLIFTVSTKTIMLPFQDFEESIQQHEKFQDKPEDAMKNLNGKLPFGELDAVINDKILDKRESKEPFKDTPDNIHISPNDLRIKTHNKSKREPELGLASDDDRNGLEFQRKSNSKNNNEEIKRQIPEDIKLKKRFEELSRKTKAVDPFAEDMEVEKRHNCWRRHWQCWVPSKKCRNNYECKCCDHQCIEGICWFSYQHSHNSWWKKSE
ncbi:uncharacterized protein [Clytia hemisphaerica]|uniref:Cnidarian restricted protein n=1 Tax=Clytia hemisphaerica TaxID=252671 RepID=A0A7M5X5L8_9CNID